MQADGDNSVEQALASLCRGDLDVYRQELAKLKSTAFTFRLHGAEARAADETVPPEEGQVASSSSSAIASDKAQEADCDDPQKRAERLAAKQAEQQEEAAKRWLKEEPKKGVVRYTFKESPPLGLKLSQDVPP